MTQKDDLFLIQIRLFRLAQDKWNLDAERCSAFDKFIKSETARMLFDEQTGMWLNGPDYLADEYKREMYFNRTGKFLGW